MSPRGTRPEPGSISSSVGLSPGANSNMGKESTSVGASTPLSDRLMAWMPSSSVRSTLISQGSSTPSAVNAAGMTRHNSCSISKVSSSNSEEINNLCTEPSMVSGNTQGSQKKSIRSKKGSGKSSAVPGAISRPQCRAYLSEGEGIFFSSFSTQPATR